MIDWAGRVIQPRFTNIFMNEPDRQLRLLLHLFSVDLPPGRKYSAVVTVMPPKSKGVASVPARSPCRRYDPTRQSQLDDGL